MAEAAGGAAMAGGPLVASASFQPSPPDHDAGCVRALPFAAFNEPTYHCHVAEVEIDAATGQIRVLRYLAVHDIGPALNPAGVRGQIEGGVVQGLGYALFEELLSDGHGRTLNDSLVDYRLPTFADIPEEIEIEIVSDHPGSDGPRGAKGIGEAPIILPVAAVGCAVRDALGAQPLALPLTAIRIRELAGGAFGPTGREVGRP
jgi:CO/xanthine dehydrogenase Mo-binding subunit